MRDYGILFGATVMVAMLAAPVAAQDAAARGRAIARTVCARCHAVRARGASPKHEAPPFRALAKDFPIDDLADVLSEGVDRRDAAMPDFRLDPDEAAGLTGYLRTLRR